MSADSQDLTPLSPASLAAVPEVRTARDAVDELFHDFHRRGTTHTERLEILITAVRDAVLSAERARLLALTEEQVVEAAFRCFADVRLEHTQGGQVSDPAKCGLCGAPMPEGEEMFQYHGYSGPCPSPRDSGDQKWVGDSQEFRVRNGRVEYRWTTFTSARWKPHPDTLEDVEREAVEFPCANFNAQRAAFRWLHNRRDG